LRQRGIYKWCHQGVYLTGADAAPFPTSTGAQTASK
jgi:hypothetical protein